MRLLDPLSETFAGLYNTYLSQHSRPATPQASNRQQTGTVGFVLMPACLHGFVWKTSISWLGKHVQTNGCWTCRLMDMMEENGGHDERSLNDYDGESHLMGKGGKGVSIPHALQFLLPLAALLVGS